ncbi:hypothetical protein DEJ03_13795 [Curtobacterium sp. MCLR17_043]|uniref:hypothetical protein n=1 Tax=Curtobacterium sp. MCLR17_043 TaxID=2175627 RepID=UPI000D9CA701|nr:hypothetical protein [Curtobacterium sp. MCLR17_043]PYY43051.1 hypothetical protein DEJ03_13795 [Curtobacterium sp. MCLR17_043]
MRTRQQRLIGLAERVLLHQPDVVPDSILFEWGDHRGDWEQTLTVHYEVGGGSAGPHHRHHYFI